MCGTWGPRKMKLPDCKGPRLGGRSAGAKIKLPCQKLVCDLFVLFFFVVVRNSNTLRVRSSGLKWRVGTGLRF